MLPLPRLTRVIKDGHRLIPRYDPSRDGRQVYLWITKPWRGFWFRHGPDRFNIFQFSPVNGRELHELSRR